VSPTRRWADPGHAAPAARVRPLSFCVLAFAAAAAWSPLAAQNGPAVPYPAATATRPEYGPGAANYRLAARWAPYKIDKLIYGTTVEPRWIKGTDRFWYEWRTSAGMFYYIVDPVRGTKRQIFDNDRLAAELTRITRDPWDGQHLPIRKIRFIDANTLRFEVQSSQDEEVEERQDTVQTEQRLLTRASQPRPRTRKKVYHFEYDVNTQTLRELEDYEEPDSHPAWASVSPDGRTVVFARRHNLYMMSGDDYRKILDARKGKQGEEADKAEEAVEVQEIQLTEDGEEHYSYGDGGRGQTDAQREKNKDKRMRAPIVWSKDSRRFASSAPTSARSATCGSSTPWATSGPSWRPTSTTCRARRT